VVLLPQGMQDIHKRPATRVRASLGIIITPPIVLAFRLQLQSSQQPQARHKARASSL
jgi:hypothetical protein